MCEIPKGYPSECKLKALKNVVRELTDALNKIGLEKSPSFPQMNRRAQLSALIQLGLGEIQGRQTRYITYISLGASLLSLFIAYSALTISESAIKSSNRWETNQISILESINKNNINSSESLSATITNQLKESTLEITQKIEKSTAANKSLKTGTAKSAAP